MEGENGASGGSSSNIIYVANIASAVTEDTLKKFFSFCGEIRSFKIIEPDSLSDVKYCVEFTDAEHANTALLLTGTLLLNKPIHVSLSSSQTSA